MKLASNLKTIAPMTGVAALLLWAVAGQFKSQGAGSLTPPAGTPTPTMPSLAEIGEKLDVLDSCGKNFALRNTTNVQVWNSATGLFTPAQTVTGLASVVESDGNFCALGSANAAAWNKSTASWSVVTNIPSASSVTKSNGNFCVIGSNKASAWSKTSGTWTTQTLTAPIRTEVSNGNFLVIGTSQAAAWNQETGTWRVQTLSNAFRDSISASE